MKLELLMGMIASGKSTYSAQRAKEGAIIVNDDSLVTSLHGGNYRLYSKDLKRVYKAVETAIISTALVACRDVIIDRTCLQRNTRQRYISMANSFGVEAHVLVFPIETPEIHANRRFKSDARGYSLEYWTDVAKFHLSQYESLDESEGHASWSVWDWTKNVKDTIWTRPK